MRPPLTQDFEDPGVLMEEIIEKLKVLNYEQDFCRAK